MAGRAKVCRCCVRAGSGAHLTGLAEREQVTVGMRGRLLVVLFGRPRGGGEAWDWWDYCRWRDPQGERVPARRM